MNSFGRRVLLAALLLAQAAAASAQQPGVDEQDCKESALLPRPPGCGIYQCVKADAGAFEVVVNKAGDTTKLAGAGERLKLICPAAMSQIQLHRHFEASLENSGYTIVFSGRHEGHERPAVTARKGAQWISVQTGDFNEFPIYEQTAVLVKGMEQQLSAGAQAMSDAIASSGRLDVYGITFAAGHAAITPDSHAVLNDVLAVLVANPDWRLRIEGHTDNVGDKAANMKLSAERAAAVAAWLAGKGIDAARLSTAGLGDTQPIGENTTEEGRARNRRVVLIRR